MRLSTKNEFTKTEDFPDSDLVVDSLAEDEILFLILEMVSIPQMPDFAFERY